MVQQTESRVNWNSVKMVVTVHTQETVIADRIGWAYDVDTGTWRNANGEVSTEESAGFVAYYHGFGYNDMASAGMRQGWLEANGEVAYGAEMVAYLKHGATEYDELPF